MSLHCHCEGMDGYGDPDWWYYPIHMPIELTTKRSVRCCSCHTLLKLGAQVYRFTRWRNSRTEIEERIHGDEVSLAPWYHCPDCHAIYARLEQIGVCVDLGDNMIEMLAEFNREYAPRGFSLKVDGVNHEEE